MSDALLLLLGLVGTSLAGVALVFLRRRRSRRRRELREALMREVAAGIRDYFRHSQTEVAVECVSRQDDAAIMALIESQPQARFRYSHVIEIGLRAYVKRAFGLDLERVYWRFPIAEIPLAPDQPPAPATSVGSLLEQVTRAPARSKEDRAKEEDALAEDAYLNARALKQKFGSEYEVTNSSWEQFEAARRREER